MSESMLHRLERLYRVFISVPPDEAPLSKRLAQKDYVNAVMDNAPALIAASCALGTLLEKCIHKDAYRYHEETVNECLICEGGDFDLPEINHEDWCPVPAALAAWEAVK